MSWCQDLVSLEIVEYFPDFLAIARAEIVPTVEEVDCQFWVVVGDLPPAIVTMEDTPDAMTALQVYCEQMRCWADAVLAGESTDDLWPVEAAETPEHAEMLSSRLDFIESRILGDKED